MSFGFSTAATDYVITLYTASSANTHTFTLFKPRASTPVPKKPKLSDLYRGQTVRVLSDGILHNRVGTVGGFISTPKGPVVFVGWPDGGCTTFMENQLQPVKSKKEPTS